jgi:hypothetical protein
MTDEKSTITISATSREELAERMQNMITVGWILEEYNADNLTARLSISHDEPPRPPRSIYG